MHAGQLASLRDVLDHYNKAPAAAAGVTELKPLHLDAVELDALEAFLRSLSGGVSVPVPLPRAAARGTLTGKDP